MDNTKEIVKKNSILIVDDNTSNIIALTHILGKENTIYAAKNGVNAIKAAEERLPDVILLDILMPEMDGYAVIASLKNSERTQNIPVIFITGLSEVGDEEKGLALGAADYISKPFSPAIVRLRVRNQLTIVEQMRTLDKRLSQQTLMTSISQSFLSGEDLDTLFMNTLRLVGESMEADRLLLYQIEDNGGSLICRNEWLGPGSSLKSRKGARLKIDDSLLSMVDKFRAEGVRYSVHSGDPVLEAAMAPYRTDPCLFITAPVYIKNELRAAIDFSRMDDGREWSESEINHAALIASIFSGVLERASMERVIIAKELAERSSRTKSEFLSRMSHEMRTPMNAIIGMTNLARGTEDRKKRDDYLEKAGEASSHLLQLIDDVLDLYDIEESRFDLSQTEFRFMDIIQESMDRINPDVKAKRQTLSLVVDPSIPESFIGDGKRLAQVISHLLSNACKFTGAKGSIQLKASALHEDKDRLTLKIEVIDDGIGISKEQQKNLFIPFEQADGGVDRIFGGAGVGLSLSKRIVELMDGEIWVESEPDKGSSFSFTVKLRIKPPGGEGDGGLSSYRGKTALLVDDVEINREIVIAMLEDTELQIECAINGREALDMFAADPRKYDLIIMDINMPEMDGVESTKRIRSLPAPEGARIPIIAMTANVLPEEIKTYFTVGMNAHIGKPVDFGKLFRMLDEYLS